MPIIDITMPENALTDHAKAALPEKLGQIAIA